MLGKPILKKKVMLGWPRTCLFCLIQYIALGICHGLAEESSISSEFRKKAPDVFEHTTDFMITVQLALFGLVGYIVTRANHNLGKKSSIFAYCVLALFGILGTLSLIFGYESRLWLIERLSIGIFDYEKTNFYLYQAGALLASAALALVVSVFVISKTKNVV
jgi:hypothetical protein